MREIVGDDHVECAECGHAIEQHNARQGCAAVDGCPCRVTFTVAEKRAIRRRNGLPARQRHWTELL